MYNIIVNSVITVVHFIIGIVLNICIKQPYGLYLLVLFSISSACHLVVVVQDIRWIMEQEKPKQRTKRKKPSVVVFWKRFLVYGMVFEGILVMVCYILIVNGINISLTVELWLALLLLIVAAFFV